MPASACRYLCRRNRLMKAETGSRARSTGRAESSSRVRRVFGFVGLAAVLPSPSIGSMCSATYRGSSCLRTPDASSSCIAVTATRENTPTGGSGAMIRNATRSREMVRRRVTGCGHWSSSTRCSSSPSRSAFFTRPRTGRDWRSLGALLGFHPGALHRDVRFSADDLPALGVAVFEISGNRFLPTTQGTSWKSCSDGAPITRISARFTS